MGNYVRINADAGSFQAYVVYPTSLPAPAVVVIQEIFGVNKDLRDTCDELASQGYLAISPDLFWRMEPGVDMTDQSEAEWKRGFAFYTAFDYDAGVSDIALTIDTARSMAGASGKVGLLGYCLGGLLTFLTAARRHPDAAVVYYGGQMEKYLDEAGSIEAPIMVHLGEEDEYIPGVAQEAIVAALAPNPSAQVFSYPGCGHAFARHQGTHFDPAAAALANGRTAEFFRSHLVP